MGTNQNAAAQTADELPDVALTPEQEFEGELASRFPNRLVKRYDMPSKIRQARAVYLLELTSKDEIDAAVFADTMMTPIEKKSLKLTAEAERRESVRLSIVGLAEQPKKDGPIKYRHVNNKGIPFVEMDAWPVTATACVQAFFNELNGVPSVELYEGLKGSRAIGAFAAPMSVTPPVGATTK